MIDIGELPGKRGEGSPRQKPSVGFFKGKRGERGEVVPERALEFRRGGEEAFFLPSKRGRAEIA